jgi:hypothetical protein
LDQKHLTYREVTNLGCFYTPPSFVNKLLSMLERKVNSLAEYTIIDTSCGYGSFFDFEYKTEPKRLIGGDIDNAALNKASERYKKVEYFKINALVNVSRANYKISENEKLIIVGNPPYNDVTSKVKKSIKQGYVYEIDRDIKTRDLGISFMLGYSKLNADYVSILHPLSYLIKKANFELLRPFLNKYILLDSVIVNSQDFTETSKGTGFPIMLAVYKRNIIGTSYEMIMGSRYKTIDGKIFDFKFDTINKYLNKYPSKYAQYDGKSPLFWTMRDINALKRSRTFVQNYCDNTVIVDKNKIAYYCYVDVFKDYIKHIPYYYGNYDVMINNEEFIKIKEYFIARCIDKYPFIKKYFSDIKYSKNDSAIEMYFKKLLGNNYVH